MKARVSLAPAKCHNILSFLHRSTGVLLCAKGFSPLLRVSLTSEMEIYGSKDGLGQPWPWKSLSLPSILVLPCLLFFQC